MSETSPPAGRKVWFITGCSSGLGRALAEHVLERGDIAVLTARDTRALAALAAAHAERAQLATLDVTRADDIRTAVGAAVDRWGRIDVLVNNAGYGFIGALEETSADECRDVFAANVWGALQLTQAVVPQMRRQGGGRIVQISSNLGLVSRAGYGLYSASKFALEGWSDALAAEVLPFGIHVVCVEPGAFRTEFLGRSLRTARLRLPAYESSVGANRDTIAQRQGKQPNDPRRGAAVIAQAVDADAPPRHLPLGADAYRNIRGKLERVAADLSAWEAVATATGFELPPGIRSR